MKDSIRIGIFVAMFPQVSETFIVTKLLKLLDAGFDVHVFALAESPHWNHFAILSGREDVRARVHVVPPLQRTPAAIATGLRTLARHAAKHPAAFTRYLRHNWRVRSETSHGFWKAAYLRAPFIGHALDILHIEFDAQGVGIADLKEFLGCHVLYSARGTFQQLSVLDDNPQACRYLFKYVDGYHVISRFLERNTRALGLPDEVPVWLIEPAIDLSLFAPPASRDASPGLLRVLSVGRLSWEKGYEIALDAVARARAQGVSLHYTICGAGPYEEPIRFAIQQLGLEECVTLTGALGREDMPAVYSRADVLLHAALAEGFCNAVIEAQAMGLPVIASDAGGLPENIEHGVTGYIVPRRDPAAMAARLVELANAPDLRARFGAAGRKRALAHFDLDDQASAFVKLYRELAARPVRSIAPL
jgi:colanic acid/amylovoran biosynthesis glycosyltransferase